MKNLIVLLLLVSGISSAAFAGDLKFGIADIPASLLKNANSVIRVHETTIEITDTDKTRKTVHYAITLLNDKASDEAEMRVYYDDNSSVSYLKFKIYNAIGMDITRSFKKLETTDESATPDGTLYSDNRCKVVSPVFAQYPVTIEYSYEKTSSLIFYLPSWVPVASTNMSLQEASFNLITPKSMKPRYREVNMVPAATIGSDGKSDTYSWKISNFAAIDLEPFSPPVYELIPYLILAPDHIKYKAYYQPFNNWNDLGKFYSFLINDRDILTPETVSKLKELVKDCPDNNSKIRAVYKYMQSRTRYVGVQIGIGGNQPIVADYVDKKGYGDCKGLVNYTKALLKAVGINSNYTLVNSGRNAPPIICDFPGDQFDHIILCVPGSRDTTWLECTSQKQAFGFLGSFTDDRDVLVVTENGGKMVRTPEYRMDQNTSSRKADISLDKDGNASVKMMTRVNAIQSENVEAVIYDSPEDQKKGFYKRSGLPDSRINSLKYTLNGDFLPEGTEEADLFVPAYASRSNNRFFLPLILPDRISAIPSNTGKRVSPVVIHESFIDRDTMNFTIPTGFEIEFKPEAQIIDSKFGNYSLSVEKSGDHIICTRSFSIRKNRYSAEEYTNFISFLKKVSKADQTKVVLVQKG